MTHEEAKYLRMHPMKNKLDPKALEAARAATSRTRPKLDVAITAYLNAADLVPRGETTCKLRYEKPDRTISCNLADERDEARREAATYNLEQIRLGKKLATQAAENLLLGEQLAALREALLEAKSLIRTWHNMPVASRRVVDGAAWDIYDRASPEMKRINAALTDTAPEDKE